MVASLFYLHPAHPSRESLRTFDPTRNVLPATQIAGGNLSSLTTCSTFSPARQMMNMAGYVETLVAIPRRGTQSEAETRQREIAAALAGDERFAGLRPSTLSEEVWRVGLRNDLRRAYDADGGYLEVDLRDGRTAFFMARPLVNWR